MIIVKYRKIFFIIAAVLSVVSIFSLFYFGLKFGIDFKGGSIVEVSYAETRPDVDTVRQKTSELSFGNIYLQPSGEKDLIVKTKELNGEEHSNLLYKLSLDGQLALEEKKFNSIGPSIGKELRSKAWLAVVSVILGIVLFIAFAFRKVSEQVSSWKYGIITTIALLHDIIIPAGIFAALGKEVDSLFVVAILSVMGLSVHDTIVVFDRIRENLKLKISDKFEETVGKSLNQTFTRSINTSLTIVLVLLSLFLLDRNQPRTFLLLLIGIIVGTYSSIFVASPCLYLSRNYRKETGNPKTWLF